MATVLTVQANLNGDAASIISAARQAASALKKTKEAADEASAGSEAFGSKLQAAATKALGAVGRIATTVAKVGLAVAATGAAAGTALAFAGAKAGLDRLEAIQDSTVALTRMLGSSAAAADLTAKALAVVQGTPFAFPQFAEATRTLVAFGVQAEKVPGVLQAIADSAAASGRGADAVDGLTQAFANLEVQGKVSSDILQQLGTSGVNGLGILANAFGKSTGDMQEMISQGLVPADKAMDILVDGIENGSHGIAGDFNSLAGAAQDLGQTVSGSLGNVKAAFARMGASWLEPFKKDLPDTLNNGVIPLLNKLGQAGARVTDVFAKTGALQRFDNALKAITDRIDPVADGMIRVVKNTGPLIDGFVGIVKNLSPLNAVLEAFKKVWPEISAPLQVAGQTMIREVVPALVGVMKAIIPILPPLAQLASAFASGLAGALVAVTPLITTLVQALTPLINMIAGLPQPVLAAGVAFLALHKAGVPVGGMLTDLLGLLPGVGDLLSSLGLKAAGSVGGIGGLGESLGGGAGLLGRLGGVTDFLFGPWGIAIGSIALIGSAIENSIPKAAATVDSLRASFDLTTGAITKTSDAMVLKGLIENGALASAKKLGVSTKDLVLAAEGNADASKRVNDQMLAQVSAANKAADGNQALAGKANQVSSAYQTVAAQLGATTANTLAAKKANEDYLQTAGAAQVQGGEFKTALESLNGALAANGLQTDKNSAAYRTEHDALLAAGGQGKEYIETLNNQYGASVKTEIGTNNTIKSLVAAAEQMGMSSSEAEAYTAKLLGIPVARVTAISAETAAALQALQNVRNVIDNIPRNVSINVQGAVHINTAAIYTGGNAGFANGGMVEKGVQAFANGGMRAAANGLSSGIFKGSGDGLIKFAEKQTNWEAFISGRHGQESRNRDIWLQTGAKLGMLDSLSGKTEYNFNVQMMAGESPDATISRFVSAVRFAVGG